VAKHGLGKGLDALLPQNGEGFPPPISGEGSSQGLSSRGELFPGPPPEREFSGEGLVPLDKLRANPAQPRKNFDEGALGELADSIREHGIIQPVIVEDAGDGTYLIVAGERRIRAARLAGLTEVPAILRDYSGERRMEVSLIENVQREDLNPIEEAAAYRQLMELTGLSQDAVAARVGKNRSTVANALRLLKLPSEMRTALEEGKLSPGHARAILSLPGQAPQETLFQEILRGELSVRDAEKRAAALNGRETSSGSSGSPAPLASPLEKPGAGGRPAELAAMEEQFIGRLGTRVVIEGDLTRGRIRIDYYSLDDLDRLYGILGGSGDAAG
jgi:ParB family chromosome partitioning protein